MEVGAVLYWTFFCIAALLSSIFLNLIKHKLSHNKKLPPGDLGLPWIGETLDFYKAQTKCRLFEEFVQPRIAKYGNVFKTNLMGEPTVIVNGAEANRFFLSNEFKLVVSSWPSTSVELMGKNSIMEKQGKDHRCLRRLIASTLCHNGLESLVPKICNTVRSFLNKNWNQNSNYNNNAENYVSLYRSTKALTFTIVFECLLGIPVKPRMLNTFKRVLEGVFAPHVNLPGTKFWKAKKARDEIEEMIVKIVRDKRRKMEDGVDNEENGNLLSNLVGGLIRGEISEVEVVDNVILLVFGAHDTTSFAIAMTFKMIAQHRDYRARLLQEHNEIIKNKRRGENLTMEDIKKMEDTWSVAKETMRLFPPIFGSFRKGITDIEYEGFIIPKGYKVLWTTYGTHYNEDHFKDALSFNPKRFEEKMAPYVYVPFGGGPRVCAGTHLAKLNILILIHFVMTRYDWSLVYPDEPVTMAPLPLPSLGMPIKISPLVRSM